MNKNARMLRGLILGLALALLLHAVPAGAPAQDNATDAAQASDATGTAEVAGNATGAGGEETQALVLPTEAVLTVVYCAESIGEWQPCPS